MDKLEINIKYTNVKNINKKILKLLLIYLIIDFIFNRIRIINNGLCILVLPKNIILGSDKENNNIILFIYFKDWTSQNYKETTYFTNYLVCTLINKMFSNKIINKSLKSLYEKGILIIDFQSLWYSLLFRYNNDFWYCRKLSW